MLFPVRSERQTGCKQAGGGVGGRALRTTPGLGSNATPDLLWVLSDTWLPCPHPARREGPWFLPPDFLLRWVNTISIQIVNYLRTFFSSFTGNVSVVSVCSWVVLCIFQNSDNKLLLSFGDSHSKEETAGQGFLPKKQPVFSCVSSEAEWPR